MALFVTDMLALSHVPRWAIVRTEPQSVADHSFRVAVIAAELIHLHGGNIPGCRMANVLWHALTHDADESVTGDIPSVAKHMTKGYFPVTANNNLLPLIGGLNPEEFKLVKLADYIEATTFISLSGIGPHAMSVLNNLRSRTVQFAHECKFFDIHLVTKLMDAIESEYGRFRPDERQVNA